MFSSGRKPRQLDIMTEAEATILEKLDALAQDVAELQAATDMILARMGERLLSRREVARLAGCSTRTVKRREDEGVLQRVPGLTRAMYHPHEVRRTFGIGAGT